MKRPALVLTLLLLATPGGPALLAEPSFPSLRIVVHADNPVEKMDGKMLSKIFYKRVKYWQESRQPIVPVDQNKDRPVRGVFSMAIHGKSASHLEKYWQRRIFSGQGVPPTRLSSDQAVLAYVRDNPGSIGYVDADAPLLPGVRSLLVVGLVTAADEDPHGWVAYPSETSGEVRQASSQGPISHHYDEVLAERGQVRLMLTGSCGPNDQGRQVLLQNRSPVEPARVTTETSQWTRGDFKSSSRDLHVLAGHQEKRLGCTHLSGDVELRYALARASDNSGRPDRRRDPSAPPRDFISLIESGTCGQKGEGRRIVAVNRHSDREIVIAIKRVQKLNGDFRNQALKSYRLRPGAERELGCDQLGNLDQEFHLVESR